MRTINRKTAFKYLNFLNDVYEKCIKGEDFTFQYLCSKHKISKGASIEMKKSNIITIDEFGYKWNTIKPNIKMAEEILKRSNSASKIKKTTKEVKRIGSGRKKKDVEVAEYLEKYTPKTKTISILWGLVKINKSI